MKPCKSCMAADKGDRQHESLESTHSYCNTEEKEKKKPKSWFWKLRYFPKEAGKSSDLPGCQRGGEDAPCRCRSRGDGGGQPAASALLTSIAR